MSNQQHEAGDYFFGIMVRKDGKWMPHSKYDMKSLGTAMIRAESLDTQPEFEAVKLMKIPVNASHAVHGGEAKEIWVSPRLRALSEIHAGVNQSCVLRRCGAAILRGHCH